MIYKVNDIAQDVLQAMDRNRTSHSLLSVQDEETLMLRDAVRGCLLESARKVLKSAPVHMLEGGHQFGESVHWEKDGCGWILLPDDFLRLLLFEMSDWHRSVYDAILVSDPRYIMQKQGIRALRGTPERPVCAIVRRHEGLSLEFYSCRSEDAFVSKALYVPYPSIDENDGLDMSERCYKSFVYAVAAATYRTLNEIDRAQLMDAMSAEELSVSEHS